MTKTNPTREELMAQLEELERKDTVAAQASEIDALKAELATVTGQRDKALAAERDALGTLKEIDKLLAQFRSRFEENTALARQQRRDRIMQEAREAQSAKIAAHNRGLGGTPGAKAMTPAKAMKAGGLSIVADVETPAE